MKQIQMQSTINNMASTESSMSMQGINANSLSIIPYQLNDLSNTVERNNFTNSLLQNSMPAILDSLIKKIKVPASKKSFLVFKHNKYTTVPTQNIAYFHVKYETSFIVSYDRQEYAVNYSLEQLQQLLSGKQFFRLNRQYLVSFNAVKDVEHYFARKLLVNLTVAAPEKLLVSKERSTEFLHWLENR